MQVWGRLFLVEPPGELGKGSWSVCKPAFCFKAEEDARWRCQLCHKESGRLSFVSRAHLRSAAHLNNVQARLKEHLGYELFGVELPTQHVSLEVIPTLFGRAEIMTKQSLVPGCNMFWKI